LSNDDYQSCVSSVEGPDSFDEQVSTSKYLEESCVKQSVDIQAEELPYTEDSSIVRNSERTEEVTPDIPQEQPLIKEHEVKTDESIDSEVDPENTEGEIDSEISLLEDLQEIEDESKSSEQKTMSTPPSITKIEALKTADVSVKDETSKLHVDAIAKETAPTAEPSTEVPNKVIVEEKEEEGNNHFDVSQHIYDGVKNVWGFGCSVGITRPFFKVTESVAGKVLNITTGIHLENGDEEIKPKLAQLDNDLVNPAINRVVSAIMPVFVKGDEIIRPVVTTVGPVILGPFGFKSPNPAVEDKVLEPVEVKGEKGTVEKKNDEASAPEMTPIPIPVQ